MQQTIDQLSALTADLYFTSETDATWTTGKLDAAQPVLPQLLALSGKTPETPVEERAWIDFLHNAATPQDWMDETGKTTAARYQKLCDYVNANLTETRVYRLGAVEIDVFVVGLAADCTPVVLATKSVET